MDSIGREGEFILKSCEKREKHFVQNGYSLIEMVIVIAIMALMVSFTALGFGLLRSGDTKKCAEEINSGLTQLKSRTMAKNKPEYMRLSQRGDQLFMGYYTRDDAGNYSLQGTEKEIASGDVSVSCDSVPLTNGDTVTFAIRKKDGAFEAVDGDVPKKIEVKGNQVYNIVLIKDTGRHYIE